MNIAAASQTAGGRSGAGHLLHTLQGRHLGRLEAEVCCFGRASWRPRWAALEGSVGPGSTWSHLSVKRCLVGGSWLCSLLAVERGAGHSEAACSPASMNGAPASMRLRPGPACGQESAPARWTPLGAVARGHCRGLGQNGARVPAHLSAPHFPHQEMGCGPAPAQRMVTPRARHLQTHTVLSMRPAPGSQGARGGLGPVPPEERALWTGWWCHQGHRVF